VGARVGRRLFDDGSGMAEKNLVTIGDDVTLGAGSFIQCHTQEDYAFKCDSIRIGSGCTVGVAVMVHYGTTMEDGSSLAPDTFLMKGSEVPANEYWGGNPGRELDDGLRRLSRADTPSPLLTGTRRLDENAHVTLGSR
jgi:non-ribosomal peptide synthetase-like protein